MATVRCISLFWGLQGLLVGCGPAISERPIKTVKTEASRGQVPPSQVGEEHRPCAGPNLVHRGTIQYEGQLGRTKGAQLTINHPKHGWAILSVPADVKGREWHTQRVRVSGDLCVYECPPMAQCLTTGSIPFVKNVDLEIISDQ